MTMLIEIKPEAEAELIRQAASQGIDVQAYAARLLEEAAKVPAESKPFSVTRLRATLKEMGQFSHKMPALSDEALSRASIYADHD